ncbi:alpha/beta hydrolase [Vibrio sp. CAIM 722]|uniref:Alpha/beta hydrolase n=2 Tax=Vibrio TaxID=662 RepID=A0A7X4RT74_9VIBR|nr:alpha/beta hydrolase [Vibrio nitrifigilis]MZI91930.1 alpha/beta hydrolase [Vibrio eleionomae]
MNIKNTYIPISRNVPGVFYQPKTISAKAQVAVLVMHSDENYLNFPACTELSKRGYSVLCANVAKSQSSMEQKMLNVKSAIEYLQNRSDIKKILLLGHSGGATLMTAYQTIAENGVKSVQGTDKMIHISDAVNNMPAADGVILLDANWGNGPMTLFSLDPAVKTEGNGVNLDSRYDLYSSKNGFTTNGAHYSKEFKQQYLTAQRERYNKLVTDAENRVQAIEKGKGNYVDDEPFIVTAGAQMLFNNKLYPQDVSLLSHTKEKWTLLHADGSETTQVIHSVRLPLNLKSNTSSINGVLVTTAKNFLSRVGIRVTPDYNITEDGVTGIDWRSNITSPIGNIEGVHRPLLLMGMTGSWEYLASEAIYQHANNSKDKTLAFVEGATHMFTPNKQAEKTQGEFGDTMKTLFDYVDHWISQDGRFIR